MALPEGDVLLHGMLDDVPRAANASHGRSHTDIDADDILATEAQRAAELEEIVRS